MMMFSMPMIDAYAATDLFPAGTGRQLAEELTKALLRAEGVTARPHPVQQHRRLPSPLTFRKAITMKDAKTLLLEFLAAVTHGENAAALFAEDGAVELPFLHSLGVPWRHRGRQAISELQDSLAGLYLDFAFRPEDTHVLIDTPEQVFAEYMAHPTARATGRTVHHLFTGRLVAENGQIKLLRESLNPFAVAQALLPGGVKDLSDPEKVIFSVPPDYRS
jgi:ketosteroid isomerase-like protein